MNGVIPSDAWKKYRDRIAGKARRRLHIQEVNPGAAYKLRYDYILTAAEVKALVESVMNETEQLVIWHLERDKANMERFQVEEGGTHATDDTRTPE